MMNRRTEILTIPNLLTLSRILLIPVYLFFYLRGKFIIAGCLLTLSCLTDLADGWVARRFHMTSSLGMILDPLADKITQLALILCLSLRYPILRWILVLFLIKEILQVSLGLCSLGRGKAPEGALPVGKFCTAVLFITLTIPIFFPGISPAAVGILALLDAMILSISLASYVLVFLRK